MYIELIPEAGKFYKVNMHCHTTLSDGKQTPEEVKKQYMDHGYSAVAFTDHEILFDQRDLCDENFVALHGYETAIKSRPNEHTALFQPVYHFNMIAKKQDNLTMVRFFKNNPSFPGKDQAWADLHARYSSTIDHYEYNIDWINDYTKAVKEAGFLINYNHPQWSLQDCRDFIGLQHLHSLELINGGCIPHNDNTALHYEQMLRSGMKVCPTGGDDNHSEHGCFAGWTMIKAPSLTYDALISAYEQGHCYASEGPEILSLVLQNEKIKIKTSPASQIVLFSEGRYVDRRKAVSELIIETEFAYRPEAFGSFFRIEVRDAHGCKAFSNAYYTKDIATKPN